MLLRLHPTLMFLLTFILTFLFAPLVFASDYVLPPVPVPKENPMTDAKRILGKILFWDEQLSVDNSVACGTCHQPEHGGADGRQMRHPGKDGQFNTADDVFGSPGIVARLANGVPIDSAIFHHNIQVTARAAPSYFLGLWADELFWDGRAGKQLVDPITKELSIRSGAALENQALGPLLSAVEMGQENRQWQVLIDKLTRSKPLVLASKLPPDIRVALADSPSYPALFKQAFSSNDITVSRIVMAIATHERSLVTDQTPWDIAQKTGNYLPGSQQLGWEIFKQIGCDECHKPPLFTDNKFHNIGIRALTDDVGRMAVSANKKDKGAMKTPSLRNIALKKNFMHTGQFNTLGQVIDAYADVPFERVAHRLVDGKKYNFNVTEFQRRALLNFLQHSLTDPRLSNNTAPFDRPMLRTEKVNEVEEQAESVKGLKQGIDDKGNLLLEWRPSEKAVDYIIKRKTLRGKDDLWVWTSNTHWQDQKPLFGQTYKYEVIARTLSFRESVPVVIDLTVKKNTRMEKENNTFQELSKYMGLFFIVISSLYLCRKFLFR